MALNWWRQNKRKKHPAKVQPLRWFTSDFAIEKLEERLVPAVVRWDGVDATGVQTLDDLWSNRFNWAGDQVPVSGDDIVFPNHAARQTNTRDVTTSYRSLTFEYNPLISTIPGNFVLQGNNTVLGLLNTSDMTLGAGGLIDQNPSGSNIVQLNVTLNTSPNIQLSGGNNLEIRGNLGGVVGLNKQGPGTLRLIPTAVGTYAGIGPFTYTGDTSIAGGTLQMVGADILPHDTNVTVNTGATLDLNDNNVTVETLGGFAGGAGSVDLGAATLTMTNNDSLRVVTYSNTTGGITGSGNIVKQGAHTWVIPSGNTYTGQTFIQGGIVRAGNTASFGSGQNTAATGTVLSGSAAILLENNITIDNERLTLDGTGAIPTGALGHLQNLTGNNSWNGDIAFANNPVLSVDTNTGVVALTQTLTGTGGFTKVGPGDLTLRGNNTFSGTVTVTDGSLTLQRNVAGAASTPLGATGVGNGVILSNSSTLNFDGQFGNLTVNNEPLSLATTGSIRNLVGNNTWQAAGGTVTLNSNLNTIDTVAGTLTINSNIDSGIGNNLTKVGTGTLSLGGNSNFTGQTLINAGTVTVTSGNGLGSGGVGNETQVLGTSVLAFNNAGTSPESLVLNSSSTTGALRAAGGTSTVTGSVTLGLASNNFGGDAGATLTLSGSVGQSAGGNGITKLGSGTIVLSNTSNPYTGATIINGGVLQMNGNITSAITVNSGGTLSGVSGANSIVNATINTGGTINPGTAGGVGTLRATGAIGLTANAIFQIDVSGATADQLSLQGAASVNLNTAELRVNSLVTTTAGTVFTIISSPTGNIGASTFSGLPNNGLVLATGAGGAQYFRINYTTTAVTLTRIGITPTTAPSTIWDGNIPDPMNPTTFIASASPLWSLASNWTGASVPQAGDNLVFGTNGAFHTAPGGPNNNLTGGPLTFSSLSFSGDDYDVSGQPINLGGTAIQNLSVTSNPSITWATDINFFQTPTVQMLGGSIAFTGKLSGNTGFNVSSGTVSLFSNQNNYTGTTALTGGVLQAATANALPATTSVTLAGGSSLLVLTDQTISNLTGAAAGGGGVVLGNAGLPANLTLTNGSGSFGGLAGGTGGSLTGIGTFTKGGTGTWTFRSGTSNTSTSAVISGGTLEVNGAYNLSQAGPFATNVIQVQSGGTLAGSANITTPGAAITLPADVAVRVPRGTVVAANGRLAPNNSGAGSSFGTLQLDDLLLESGSITEIDLDYNFTTSTVINDQIDASDSLVGIRNGAILRLNAIGAIPNGVTYTILRAREFSPLTGLNNRFRDDAGNFLQDGQTVLATGGSNRGKAFRINYTATAITLTPIATTRVWNGNVNNQWATDNNWTIDRTATGGFGVDLLGNAPINDDNNLPTTVDNVAPVFGDNLVFPVGAANQLTNNNYFPGTTFNNVAFNDDYTITGNNFTVTGTLSAGSAIPSTIRVAADVTVSGLLAGFSASLNNELLFQGNVSSPGATNTLTVTGPGQVTFRDTLGLTNAFDDVLNTGGNGFLDVNARHDVQDDNWTVGQTSTLGGVGSFREVITGPDFLETVVVAASAAAPADNGGTINPGNRPTRNTPTNSIASSGGNGNLAFSFANPGGVGILRIDRISFGDRSRLDIDFRSDPTDPASINDGPFSAYTAGTHYDQLQVLYPPIIPAGGVFLRGFLTGNGNTIGGLPHETTSGFDFAPGVGSTFTILSNLSVAPQLLNPTNWIRNRAGNIVPDGGLIELGNNFANDGKSRYFRLNYNAGDGNDVVLTSVATDLVFDNGQGDLNWATENNWAQNILPLEMDDLVFNTTTVTTSTNNFAPGRLINSIHLGASPTGFTTGIAAAPGTPAATTVIGVPGTIPTSPTTGFTALPTNAIGRAWVINSTLNNTDGLENQISLGNPTALQGLFPAGLFAYNASTTFTDFRPAIQLNRDVRMLSSDLNATLRVFGQVDLNGATNILDFMDDGSIGVLGQITGNGHIRRNRGSVSDDIGGITVLLNPNSSGPLVNNYNGRTVVLGGTLRLGNQTSSFGNQLPDPPPGDAGSIGRVVVEGGILDSSNFTEKAGSLESYTTQASGRVFVNGNVSLQVGSNNRTTFYTGTIIGAGGGITKQGTGILTFQPHRNLLSTNAAQINAYTGQTIIEDGIFINNVTQETSPVVVKKNPSATATTLAGATLFSLNPLNLFPTAPTARVGATTIEAGAVFTPGPILPQEYPELTKYATYPGFPTWQAFPYYHGFPFQWWDVAGFAGQPVQSFDLLLPNAPVSGNIAQTGFPFGRDPYTPGRYTLQLDGTVNLDTRGYFGPFTGTLDLPSDAGKTNANKSSSGNSPGLIEVQGDLRIEANTTDASVFQVELNGPNNIVPQALAPSTARPSAPPPDPVAGQDYDQVKVVGGTVTLGVPNSVSTYPILNVLNGVSTKAYDAVTGRYQAFTIIDNDGADQIQGLFRLRDTNGNTRVLREGDEFFAPLANDQANLNPSNTHPPRGLFRISYRGGDGNDVTLTRLPTTFVWDGIGQAPDAVTPPIATVDSNWTTPTNWGEIRAVVNSTSGPPTTVVFTPEVGPSASNGDTAPLYGDDLIFPHTATARFTNFNTYPSYNTVMPANFRSITITGKGYTFGNNAIALGDLISNSGGVTADIQDADPGRVSLFDFKLPVKLLSNITFKTANAQTSLVISGGAPPISAAAAYIAYPPALTTTTVDLGNFVATADIFDTIVDTGLGTKVNSRISAALIGNPGVAGVNAGLSKTGFGTLEIANPNNQYNGPTIVGLGTLLLSPLFSAGSNSTLIPDISAVRVDWSNLADITTRGKLDLNDLNETIGSLAGDGLVDLRTGRLTTGFNNQSTSFNGDLIGSNTAGITKIGTPSSIWTLSGTGNNYPGETRIQGGTLRLSGPGGVQGVLPDITAVVVSAGATFDLGSAANTEIVGSIDDSAASPGTGNIIINNRNLQVGGDNITPRTFNGPISGTSGGFTKVGTGVLTLNGNNSYFGTTDIRGGTLVINGVQPNSSVNVSTPAGITATMGGHGTTGRVTLDGGTESVGQRVNLSPGDSTAPGVSTPGQLTVAGDLTLAQNSRFTIQLNGSLPGNTANSYDQVVVTNGGRINLGNGVNNSLLTPSLGFTLVGATSPGSSDTFRIIDNTAVNSPASQIQGLFKIDNPSAPGTFITLTEGTVFRIGNRDFRITYQGGDGNDVDLVAQPMDITWDGIANGGITTPNNFWQTTGNWINDTAPIPGDNLIFPGSAQKRGNLNDFPVGTLFGRITFQPGGVGLNQDDYVLQGNSLRLADGIVANNAAFTGVSPGNLVVVDVPVQLAAVQTIQTSNTGARLLMARPVTLDTFDLTFQGAGETTMGGQILQGTTGGGGLIKNDGGTVIISNLNTYTGLTTINAGIVKITAATSLGSNVAGTVINTTGTLQIDSTSNITITGEALTAGGTGSATGGAQGVLENLNGDNTWTGPINLQNANALVHVNSGQLTLGGAISEPALQPFGIVKTGTGNLLLGGVNTYTGNTQANVGRVIINGTQPNSPVIVSANAFLGGIGTAGATSLSTGTINPGNLVTPTLSGTGTLSIAGALSLDSTSTLEVQLNGAALPNYDRLAVSGPINLAGNPSLLATLNFASAINDAFMIVQNTSGAPVNGRFKYTDALGTNTARGEGATIIIGNRFFTITYAGNDTTLGTTLGADGDDIVLIHQRSTLRWDGGSPVNNNWTSDLNWNTDLVPFAGDDLVFGVTNAQRVAPANNSFPAGTSFHSLQFDFLGSGSTNYTLSGNRVVLESGGLVTTTNATGTSLLTLPITIGQNQPWDVATGTSLQVNGTIDGTAGFTKQGAGTAIITGNNASYGGAVAVSAGTLEIRHSFALGNVASGTTVTSGGTVAFNNLSGPISEPFNLNGPGVGNNGALLNAVGNSFVSADAVLQSDSNIGSVVSTSLSFTGTISGTGGFTKVGAGTIALAGNNSYTGTTSVNDGVLVVNGSQASSPVVVRDTGTLAGTGTLGALSDLIDDTGVIAPGAFTGGVSSPGILNTGALSLTHGSTLQVQINNSAPTGYDQLNVTGTINLGNSTTAAPFAPRLSVLLNPGFTPAVGTVFNIVRNDGTDAVPNTSRFRNALTNTILNDGDVLTIGTQPFRIFYNAGDGNDIVLIASPVTAIWDGRTDGGPISGDSNWQTGSNWIGDVAPLADYFLVFPAGAAHTTNTNNFANTSFDGMQITGDNYSFTGNGVTIGGGGINITNTVTTPTTLTLAGPTTTPGLTFSVPSSINIANTAGLQLNSVVAGTQGLTKTGTGPLFLNLNNTYTGPTNIQAGTLQLSTVTPAATDRLPNTSAIVMSGSGVLDLDGNTETIANLAGTGNAQVLLNNGTLLFGDTSSTSFGTTGVPGFVGPGTLVKQGAGSFTLQSGSLHSASNFQVNGGTVALDGQVATTSAAQDAFLVLSAGTLAGSGTIVSTGGTTISGNFVPGSALTPGTFTTGNLTLTNTATVSMNFDGPLAANRDLVVVSGNNNLTLQNATFVGSLGTGYLPVNGDKITLFHLPGTGTVTGAFSVSSVVIGGKQFTIALEAVDGDGRLNDVVLTAVKSVRQWSGAGIDNNWTTNLNWTGNLAPLAGDDLLFPAPPVQRITNVNNFTAGQTFDNITFGTNISSVNYTITGNALNLTGNIDVVGTAGAQTFNPNLTFSATGHNLTTAANTTLALGGILGGAGANLTKAGAGSLTLTGNNTFTGTFTANAGVTTITKATGLGDTTGTTSINNDAVLQIQGDITVGENITLNSTGGANGALVNSSGSNTLSSSLALAQNSAVGVPSGSLILAGINETAVGLNFTKLGTGTLTLTTNNNLHTGRTEINAGTLSLLGNVPNSTVSLNAGGTLINTGNNIALGALQANGGILGVGGLAIPGRLNVTGALTGITSTEFRVDINGTNAGTDHDQLRANGVALGNGAFKLIPSLNFIPGFNTQFTLIENTSLAATTGQLADATGTLIANGGVVTINGLSFQVNYDGGVGGNDVVLTTLARTFVWDGAPDAGGTSSNTNWNNPQNWVGDAAPTTGNSLLFPAGARNQVNNNNFDPNTIFFGSVTFSGPGYVVSGNNLRISGGVTTSLSTAGSITLNNPLTLLADQTFQTGNSSTLVLNGALNNAGFNLAFDGVGNASSVGVLSGTGQLVKNGTGTLTLGGTNTFTGSTSVNAGVLTLQNSNGLGSNAAGTTVNGSATLQLQGNFTVGSEALTLTGTGGTNGILYNLSGTNTWQGNITLNNNANLGVGTGQLTLSGVLGEDGATRSITKIGNGTLVLAGSSANTYQGVTLVNAGILNVQKANALGTSTNATDGTTVASGATLQIQSPLTMTLPETLNLNGTGGSRGALQNVTGANIVTGTVTLDSASTLSTSAGSLQINTLSSNNAPQGALTKTGTGTLLLPNDNNAFRATITVNEGILQAGNAGSLGDNALGTTVGSGASLQITSDALTFTEPLTLNGAGVANGPAALDFQPTNSTLTWDGLISNDTSPANIGVAAGSSLIVGSTGISAANVGLAGSNSFTKTGTGSLELRVANTFSGALTVSQGSVLARHSQALGTTGAGTTVNSGASLALQGFGGSPNLTLSGETLTLNGTGVGSNGALVNQGGSHIWLGKVILNSATSIGVTNPADSLTLSQQISGTGNFSKVGTGSLVLTGSNTFTGTTTVATGVLNIRSSTALGTTTGGTVVQNGARLEVQGPLSVGLEPLNLSGDGGGVGALLNISGNNAWSGTVTLATPQTFIGVNNTDKLTLTGAISGTGNELVKVGTGTLDLRGSNTYARSVVGLGTLLINGTQANSAVSVGTGSFLSGAGTAGNIDVSGSLLTLGTPAQFRTGNVAFNALSRFNVTLNGNTPGNGVGNFTQIRASGSVVLNGNVDLFLQLGFTPTVNTVFTLIDNLSTSAIQGTGRFRFNGITLNEGAVINVGALQFRISYKGGTGNDVTLRRIA